jgi:glycosyltransferase involved in cell wall biosynthesis
MWLRAAYREAVKLHRHVRFDLAHHVSWATIGAAPMLWKLPIPFFWSVGGAQSVPKAFRRYAGFTPFSQSVRSLRLAAVTSTQSFQRAARTARLILSANRETKIVLERAGAQKVQLFLDLGVDRTEMQTVIRPQHIGPVILHWSGRLIKLKALPLALEAVAVAVARGVDVHLEITGDGPERSRNEELAGQLGIADRISFLGFVPREEVLARFRLASAFIMTSVRETFGSALMEATSQGVPAIALDQHGIGALFPPDAGWKIPVTTPQETAVRIADAIEDLARDPAGRDRRAMEALRFAEANAWDRRAEQMEQFYNEYR